MRICLISGDPRLYQSLNRYWSFVVGQRMIHIPVPGGVSQDDCLAAFQYVADSLEEQLSRNSAGSAFTAILDPCFFGAAHWTLCAQACDLSKWTPIGTDVLSLFPMLVMAFPEVHWVCFTDRRADLFAALSGALGDGAEAVDESRIRKWQCLSLPGSRSAPKSGLGQLVESIRLQPRLLFDATGLRNYLRTRICEQQEQHKVRVREGCAAAIDEEEPYVFLHGYLAYKVGYRAHAVSTRKMMDELFGDETVTPPIGVTFQDIFLNFPDDGRSQPQSDLQGRFGKFQGLQRIGRHIFVSVGHKYSASYKRNRVFFQEERLSGRMRIERVFKPSGGMYNLLKDARLLKDYWTQLRDWIKATAPPKGGEEQLGAHSAPGKLVMVADRLNDRAEKILKEAQTVQECIVGATLALEATELLGYRTPTTALESIALRHQLEVKAECMFYGVGYNIDVKNRLKEIDMETKATGRWFHSSVKTRSVLNAQMSIVTALARIFREYGQFDEEMRCLRRLRDLNRRWYFCTHPWFLPLWLVRWYVEELVGSFALFVGMLFIWPLSLGVVASTLHAQFDHPPAMPWGFWAQIWNAFISFFGLQPGAPPLDAPAEIITLALVLLGFLHLGIFVAHLYTLISRR
ncbi:MAG: hypothetical protein H5U38_09370 [Calditrichaeota bacterium]|nr:hypothetical protein [Calditrichota bacterium]